jgi:hypothetical protein
MSAADWSDAWSVAVGVIVGWVVWGALVALVGVVRDRHRLRVAAARQRAHTAPLDPCAAIDDLDRVWWQAYGDRLAADQASGRIIVGGFRVENTWSNVDPPPGGQRYLSTPARFFPHARPYDWSTDDRDHA